MDVGKDSTELGHDPLIRGQHKIMRLFCEHLHVGYLKMREQFPVGNTGTYDCINALNSIKSQELIVEEVIVYSSEKRETKYKLTRKGLDAKL